MNRLTTSKSVAPIRKICFASSVLFNLSACVYGWTAPIGAALGCAANLVDSSDLSLAKEFQEAIAEALERTLESTTSESQRQILSELCEMEVEPENLKELIEKTESYQTQYCTFLDEKEVVDRFEMYFRSCIPNYPKLYRQFSLSTGIASLDQLKQVCKAIYAQTDSIDELNDKVAITHKEVLKVNRYLAKFEQGIRTIAREVSFILVSMAVFLILGIVSKAGFEQFWIFSAMGSYAISAILVYCLEKSGYIPESFFGRTRETSSSIATLSKKIATIVLPAIISMSCFMIITLSTNKDELITYEERLYYAIAAIFLGGLLSRIIRLSTSFNSSQSKKLRRS